MEEVGGYHCSEHCIHAVARGAGVTSVFWVMALADHTHTAYWTYTVNNGLQRGCHCHFKLSQVKLGNGIVSRFGSWVT